jgi:hypothetical protein
MPKVCILGKPPAGLTNVLQAPNRLPSNLCNRAKKLPGQGVTRPGVDFADRHIDEAYDGRKSGL